MKFMNIAHEEGTPSEISHVNTGGSGDSSGAVTNINDNDQGTRRERSRHHYLFDGNTSIAMQFTHRVTWERPVEIQHTLVRWTTQRQAGNIVYCRRAYIRLLIDETWTEIEGVQNRDSSSATNTETEGPWNDVTGIEVRLEVATQDSGLLRTSSGRLRTWELEAYTAVAQESPYRFWNGVDVKRLQENISGDPTPLRFWDGENIRYLDIADEGDSPFKINTSSGVKQIVVFGES